MGVISFVRPFYLSWIRSLLLLLCLAHSVVSYFTISYDYNYNYLVLVVVVVVGLHYDYNYNYDYNQIVVVVVGTNRACLH